MMQQVKALVFDVFGTVVDWRNGIARDAKPFLAKHGRPDIDPHRFADAWRKRYQPAMEEVRSGRRPFTRLDVLHRENLDGVLRDHGIDPAKISEAELDALMKMKKESTSAMAAIISANNDVVAPQASRHVSAHAPQSNDTYVHRRSLSYVCSGRREGSRTLHPVYGYCYTLLMRTTTMVCNTQLLPCARYFDIGAGVRAYSAT